MGAPPDVTTNDIVHALTSSRPRTRYVQGNTPLFPIWMTLRVAWFLPDRMFDFILANV